MVRANQYTGPVDLTGQKFGRWVVLKMVKAGSRVHYLCQCVCGNKKIVRPDSLKNGRSKSCGCLNNEMRSAIAKKANTTHGNSKTRIYSIWNMMRQRCYNRKSTSFQYYGARGISVCPSWRTFDGFFKDMGEGWFSGGSIERVDVNGNYEPDNCIWIPRINQNKNTRQNIIVTYKGKKERLVNLCDRFGIHNTVVRKRITRGWTLNEALEGKTHE